MLRKAICLLAVWFCLAGSICALDTSAASAVLYDPLTGTVLYEKNADTRRGMASTTKIMTALVALELYDPEQQVTVRPEWCGIEGSSMYLKAGEKLTVRDLLYGLMLMSGNDAAAALSGLCNGGQAAFVQKMNEKAAALGLEDTSFENPSGLDGETHYSTARDMAVLAAAAMKQPELARIVETQSVQAAGRYMTNHNKLLQRLEGAQGVKTGFTKACGRCLVSAVERQGRQLIAVTLAAPDDWNDHAVLYEYGFGQYQMTDVEGAGDCGSVPVISGAKSTSRLYCNESFSMSLRSDEISQLQTVLCGPRFAYGGVRAGQQYGMLRVMLEQQILFETPVYYGDTIPAIQPEKSLIEKLAEKLRTLF